MVDALVSGASEGNLLEVRIFFWAPKLSEFFKFFKRKPMQIKLYQNDLPESVQFHQSVAIDTEAMGLRLHRDRLCLVQLCGENGICHLVQFQNGKYEEAIHLRKLLENPSVCKIFHFARFDLSILMKNLGVLPQNIYCTKIASRLVRTYSRNHGLKDLCRTLLSIEISKEEQTTDWGQKDLTDKQKKYAATDVYHLHALKEKLDSLLEREERFAIAQSCFQFLPTRALLDIIAGDDFDVFPYQSS